MKALLPFAMLLLCSETAANALSIVARRSHEPDRACSAITALIASLGKGEISTNTHFHTNELGDVTFEEFPKFKEQISMRQGKMDRAPMRIERVWRLQKHEFDPLYLVQIKRESWHEKRWVEDGEDEAYELDAGFQTTNSWWIAEFSSDYVVKLHQADTLLHMTASLHQLKGCGAG